MNFQESIERLSEKATAIKDSLVSEEATKNALILPLVTAWGYDISDPKEVLPEVNCDITGKGDRVDYVIYKDGNPIMIIECKQVDKDLPQFKGQLSKYYVATTAKFGILSNGIKWLFYSDFDRANIQDKVPFFTFDLTDFTSDDIALLERFSKDIFDKFAITRDFGNIYFSEKVKRYLQETLSPSEDFIRFISKGANVQDVELCRNTILKELGVEEPAKKDLTDEENEAVVAIEKAVSDLVDSEVFGTIKRSNYIILCKYGNMYRWVARIKISKNKKQIGFPVNAYKGCEWYDYNTIDDIKGMRNLIIQALDLASFVSTRQQLAREKTAKTPQVKISKLATL